MGYSGFPNNGIMPMHGPSLAETTAFVAVVELKSFTKAAKQLALSPPRVSEMVRNLEDRLGVRLVERTTRSVAASGPGERLLARLRPALDEYQAALESTNEFRGKPAGTLRLTAPQPVADFFLASAIPRFLAQYPEISLDLSVSDTLIDIVAERFDAGIRLGERIERDMIGVRVTDELPLVVAGSPAYFEQRGKPKTPDDLVGHDCVRIRFSSGTYVPWRFRVKRRDLEVHVEGRLGVNSVAVGRQAAIEGHWGGSRGTQACDSSRRVGDNSGDGIFSLLSEPSPNATGAEGLGGFPAQGAPQCVPRSLAVKQQEAAIGNGSRVRFLECPLLA